MIVESHKRKSTENLTYEVYFAGACNVRWTPSFRCSNTSTKWVLDSRATSHLYYDILFLMVRKNTEGTPFNQQCATPIGAKGRMNIYKGRMNIWILTNVGKFWKSIIFHATYRVPNLRTNLLSIAKITDGGDPVTFSKQGVAGSWWTEQYSLPGRTNWRPIRLK